MTNPTPPYEPTLKMTAVSGGPDSDGAIQLTAFDSPNVVDLPTLQIGLDEPESDDMEMDADVSQDWTKAGQTSFHAKLRAGLMTHWGTERDRLLRSRLCAVAIALSSILLIGFAFRLISSASTSNLFFQTDHPSVISTMMVMLRFLICLVVSGLLVSPLPISSKRIRLLQFLLFGGFVLTTMISQYATNVQCISYGEILKLAINQKNSVILLTVMLMMYAALIPDRPRIMTRVILLITLWPTTAFAFTMTHAHPMIADKDWETLRQTVAGNTIFTIFVAGLSIYISFVLNRLRKELHDAQQLGQYRLGEKLGEGGMGEVYAAEHQMLKRPVALKTIRASVGADPIALARFEREVQSTAKLSHPNNIRIYDYGHSDDGTFYYVMEYLSGMSAADLIKEFGPLAPGRAVYLMRQACQALVEAHNAEMIHRDLKPANIYIAVLGGECDFVKVLDYGLVKVASDPNVPQLTADYTVSGTPAYMSPEQATASANVDARTDIYALGAILYTLLTGRPPFIGDNAMQLMIAHVKDPVVPPSQHRPDIPADLEAVVMRSLSKKPEERYANVRELDNALAACSCAPDWNAEKARQWWLEQMEKRTGAAAS